MHQFLIKEGNTPIITAAIHDGHAIRNELHPYLNLGEHERSREEDPYTAYLSEVSDSRVVVYTSRFEVDINRPRDKAVYRMPADAWGLKVWKEPLSEEILERSLTTYDALYTQLAHLIGNTINRFGFFIMLDLHTYNFRRNSISEEAATIDNPEINIGTCTVQSTWRPMVQDTIISLSQLTINNSKPDVRENVKFKGGEFSNWINRTYGQYGCSLAIEFKKTFMDEWTGVVNIHHLNDIRQALTALLPQIRQQLEFNLTVR